MKSVDVKKESSIHITRLTTGRVFQYRCKVGGLVLDSYTGRDLIFKNVYVNSIFRVLL